MLRILIFILAPMVIGLAAYGLITKNFAHQPLMLFFLGLLVLLLGLVEFQKARKISGWMLVAVCLFLVFVSVQVFLYAPSS